MSENSQSSKSEEFKLERYKYILQQIHTLNENLYKYLSLFQTLATAIVGGGVAIFVSWKQLKVDAAMAKIGIHGLLGLLIILTMFLIIAIIIGIFSWLEYRHDEVKLLNEVIASGYRKPPRFQNFWRWYETYLIAFSVVMVMAITIFVETQIMPLMK